MSLLDRLLAGTAAAGAAPSGTGFAHVTSGNYDASARGLTGVDLTLSGQAIGTLAYFDGSSWLAFATGPAGDVLTSAGPGAVPTWAVPGAGTAPPDASLVVPPSVAALGAQGSSVAYARADHTHAGLSSFNALTGPVTLSVGPELALAAVGNALALTFGVAGQSAGDMLYFDGTQWGRIAGAVAGLVLTSSGPNAAPSWALPAAAPSSGLASVNGVSGAATLLGAGSVTVTQDTVAGTVTITGAAAAASTVAPAAIAPASSVGTSTAFARADHAHAGVHQINGILGDVAILAGANVTITHPTDSPQTLLISATGGSSSSTTAGVASLNALTGALTISGPGVTTSGSTISIAGGGAAVPAAGPVVSDGTALTSRTLGNADIASTAAIALSKLAAGGTAGQVVTQNGSGVLALASLPSGLSVPGSPSTLALFSNGANGIATPRQILETDIAPSARIELTKLALAATDGQVVLRANGTMQSGPPGQIERFVIAASTTGGTVDTLAFTAPTFQTTGGIKYVITGLLAFISKAITGSGSVTISAGTAAGGAEYMKAITIPAGTANGQRTYGLSIANEMGQKFIDGADYGYNVDILPGATINIRVVSTAGITGGEFVFILSGFAAS